MVAQDTNSRLRLVSLVAATIVSLAAGTNYAYSAWEPQLSERLNLSATQGELIGTFGNIGMYATGIPFGMLVDRKGPKWAAFLGAFFLAAGYFPIHQAYDRGLDELSVSWLCFFSFMTGMGSCSSSSAAIKAAAMNFPNARGTATAFPLAAFGLSAFFWSEMAGILFPNDTSKFLLLLAVGTSVMAFVGTFFLNIDHSQSQYTAVATSEQYELQSSTDRSTVPKLGETDTNDSSFAIGEDDDPLPVLTDHVNDENKAATTQSSHWTDATGISLLGKQDFWHLWFTLALLSGVGLMTINNIGNNTQALWKVYDPKTSMDTLIKDESFHVSALSLFSFGGRLLSGTFSDFLIKKLHASRLWCATAAGAVFTLVQFAAIKIENPGHLWIVSCLSGLGYGFLFGVMPSLVTDAFGAGYLSVNWGFMTLAPAASGYIFNLGYGSILDRHSRLMPNGERVCDLGVKCYSEAYYVTFFASLAGIVVSLFGIRHQRKMQLRLGKLQDDHRLA